MNQVNLIRYEKGRKVAEFKGQHGIVPYNEYLNLMATGLRHHIVTRYMMKEMGVQWVLVINFSAIPSNST